MSAIRSPRVTDEASLGYDGWRVAAAAANSVFFSTMTLYLFSVLLRPLALDFGWTREQVGGGFALFAASAAIAAPFWGRLFDRIPAWRVATPCLASCGLGLVALAAMPPRLALFRTVLVGIGVAIAGTTALAYTRVLTTWFDRLRGLALGVLLASAALAGVVVPPAAQAVTSRSGWRAAFALAGVSIVVIAVPILAVFVREREVQPSPRPGSGDPAPARAAFRTVRYWTLLLMIFAGAATNGGLVAHVVAHLVDRGIAPGPAALVVSTLGGSTLAGRLLAGWLLDRAPAPRVGALLIALCAVGTTLFAFAGTFVSACIAALVFGLGFGGEMDVAPYLLSRYFGLESLSTLYGFVWSTQGLGTAFGSLLLGAAFGRFGSYDAALFSLAAAALVTGLLLLRLPPPQRAVA